MEAIKTVDLTKRYGELTAVDRLNLTVHRGELLSLLGVNGAGKTTTVKMLTGLTRPSSGDAFLNGKSILTESTEVKKIIAVSPQETAVAPNLTVKENLELMCGIHGFPGEKRTRKTEELLDRFGLSEMARRKAGKLSGGWQRRLSLAMAMITEPEILFLDEPTLGLDVLARSALWDVIRTLKGKTTIILTTHYLEEADTLSDRAGIMAGGRLLFTGTPEECKQKAGTTRFEEAFVRLVKEAAK